MQLTLDLTGSLTQRFKTLRECTHWSALNARGGIAAVAAGIDMSPSQLARKLAGNPDDPHRSLDIDDWVRAVEASGDLSPVYWLVERFLPSDAQKRQAAVDQLAQLMPQIAALLEVAGPQSTPTRRK
jgi:hypothetical protein